MIWRRRQSLMDIDLDNSFLQTNVLWVPKSLNTFFWNFFPALHIQQRLSSVSVAMFFNSIACGYFTKDERHKKRMVIDYSQTVNRFTHLDAYPLPRIDEQINEIAKTKYYSTVDLKSAYYQVPLAKEDENLQLSKLTENFISIAECLSE